MDLSCTKLSLHHCFENPLSSHCENTCSSMPWSPSAPRANVWWASCASRLRSRGVKNTAPCTSSMAATVSASSTHRNFSAASSILLSSGSVGNSAIRRPSRVSSPRWFSAPSAYSWFSARLSACVGGGSMKSNSIRLWIPRLLSISTTLARLVRWISGTLSSGSSFSKLHGVKSRKHVPGPVRPALPDRCCAAALDTGTTCSDSTPVRGLKEFCFTNPASITYLIPSMVSDVSAMLVEKMTLRAPSGVGSKIRACWSAGRAEYSGRAMSSLMRPPSARVRSVMLSMADSISSWPVQKTRMSPGGGCET
mmetsp:Transcript_15676/g.59484  ORF Transcript_15676/g.59484 Transcript_15676/m.59484 type:complete len:308 (-) Transcript_15676:713-1636(-)